MVPRPTPPSRPTSDPVQTVAFVSLGCPKNLVDSERMLGLLAADGLVPTADEASADAIVVNTCGFLEAAKDESLRVIEQVARYKTTGRCKRLIVVGCLVQRHRAKVLQWCPQVDALLGVFDREQIVAAVRGTGTRADDLHLDLPVYSSIAANATLAAQRTGTKAKGYGEPDTARLRLTPRHYAYLRISEGCNQHCAFCTIPSIRGKMRSKPVAAILAEASELMADGAFELNLIGQDTTSYGSDIGYAGGLAGMLKSLDKQMTKLLGPDIQSGWLRLMYAYPSCFSDEAIDAIANARHLVKYIDMPLQHINDNLLESMRRRTSRAQTETLLAKLRDRVPGIAIRTTFITGYPGETDAQHAELVEFVKAAQFEAMGVFVFSPEPGTPAAKLATGDQRVPATVAKARYAELMLAQQQVAFEKNRKQAERLAELDVLIESPQATPPGKPAARRKKPLVYRGRSPNQAPEIDGVTLVYAKTPLETGQLVRCQVTGSSGYDLIAQPLDKPAAIPSSRKGVISLPVV